METISINMENLTEEEREQLLKLVEKGNKNDVDIFSGDDDEIGFYIDEEGSIMQDFWMRGNCFIENLIDICNFSKSKEYMERLALQQLLYRQLKQYSWQHDGDKIDWDNIDILKYSICYDSISKIWKCACTYGYIELGVVYFYSEEIAQSAIKEVIEPFLEVHNIKSTDLF